MPAATLSRRNLVIAAALAAAAALLTLGYVTRARGAASVPAEPTQTVYVAARDVAVGTAGASAVADGALVPRAVPRSQVVPDAVTAPAQVASVVVVQPLYAGEQATLRRFGSTRSQGIRSQLSGRMRVLAVPGTREQLLAGTVQQGDHVDVVATLKSGTSDTPYGAVVLRDLLVVGAPAAAAGGSADSAAAVVELTDAQARTLFFVMQNGSWTFALRPPARAVDSAPGVASAATVLGGA